MIIDQIQITSNNNNEKIDIMDVKGNYSRDTVITATVTCGSIFGFYVLVRGVSSITLTSLPNKGI